MLGKFVSIYRLQHIPLCDISRHYTMIYHSVVPKLHFLLVL